MSPRWALLFIALAAAASAAALSDAECAALGFSRPALKCTSCRALEKHVPPTTSEGKQLRAECRQCCAGPDIDHAAAAKLAEFEHATVQVDPRWLEGSSPIAVFVRERLPKLKAAGRRIELAHMMHAPPRLLLRRPDATTSVVPVHSWEAGVLEEYLHAKVRDASDARDEL